MSDIPLRDDPPPVPPVPPADGECCNSGCNPCVWDLHAEEMQIYREALKVWEERQMKKKAGSGAVG